MKSLSKSIAFILLLGLCFVFFSDLCFIFKNTVFYIFQARDIQRAINILHGQYIFFGPELTGGGHLPGPLYYYLMSVALWIKESWISVWSLQYVSIFMSCLFAYFHYFKKNESKSIALLWLILFASHPFTSWFIRVFLNVSMMLPFAVCALVLILNSFLDIKYDIRKNFYYAACFVIGLGLQFHFSLIFFFIALVFLNIYSRLLNLPSLKKVHVVIGVGLFVLPLLPYYAWLFSPVVGFKFGAETFYTGEAKEVASTLFYLVQKGLQLPTLLKIKIWTQKIIFTIPFSFLLLLLIADLKKFWIENKVLVICFLFSLFPFVLWFFSPQAIRYTILTYVSAIFIALRLFQNIIVDNQREKVFIKSGTLVGGLLVLCFFISSEKLLFLKLFSKMILNVLVGLIALIGIGWDKITFNKKQLLSSVVFCLLSFIPNIIPENNILKFNDNDKYMPSVTDWQHIWTTVRKNTGWTYEEARKRLFFIGHHMSQSAELGYKSVDLSNGNYVSNINISGFIISNRYTPLGFESDVEWILRQNIPSEIISGIKEKRIILQKSMSDKILIMPYTIIPESNFLRFFQNISEGYKLSDKEFELGKIIGNEKVVKVDENHFVFKWNECPTHNKFCSTGAFVEVARRNRENFVITTQVIGSSLAQITPWISPDWNQAWIRPFIQISCGGIKSKYEMASSIGYNRRLSHNMKVPFFQGNNSILAPFEFRLKFKCSSRDVQLSIGRESSSIDMVTQVIQLSGAELSTTL